MKRLESLKRFKLRIVTLNEVTHCECLEIYAGRSGKKYNNSGLVVRMRPYSPFWGVINSANDSVVSEHSSLRPAMQEAFNARGVLMNFKHCHTKPRVFDIFYGSTWVGEMDTNLRVDPLVGISVRGDCAVNLYELQVASKELCVELENTPPANGGPEPDPYWKVRASLLNGYMRRCEKFRIAALQSRYPKQFRFKVGDIVDFQYGLQPENRRLGEIYSIQTSDEYIIWYHMRIMNRKTRKAGNSTYTTNKPMELRLVERPTS